MVDTADKQADCYNDKGVDRYDKRQGRTEETDTN